MLDKIQQLTLRPSGDPTYSDIGSVYLHSDGRMFGKVVRGVLKGAKVVTDSYRGEIWECVR